MSSRDNKKKSSKLRTRRLARREIARRRHPRGDQLNPQEKAASSREMDAVESSIRIIQKKNEIH